jgi:hypothetical protein
MSNPALPHGLDRSLSFWRLVDAGKRAEKKFPRFFTA